MTNDWKERKKEKMRRNFEDSDKFGLDERKDFQNIYFEM
jgi:hypothetical protein